MSIDLNEPGPFRPKHICTCQEYESKIEHILNNLIIYNNINSFNKFIKKTHYIKMLVKLYKNIF